MPEKPTLSEAMLLSGVLLKNWYVDHQDAFLDTLRSSARAASQFLQKQAGSLPPTG